MTTAEQPTSATLRRLPEAELTGQLFLEQVLNRRRSIRTFTARSLNEREISQLLWAAQGVTHADGCRTAPSAGALYPLEIFLATPEGFFHYEPARHRLYRRCDDDLRPAIEWAARSQEPLGKAPALFVVAALPARTAVKYGEARGRRYAHLEAGHAAQNLLLEATALGLGAVPVGAFDDARVLEVLDLSADYEVLYLIPVGEPAE